MTYYTYQQNNSGGSFISPAITVVVKASTPAEADAKAIEAGVYFDPFFEIDCDCCGERWYSASESDASDVVPEVSEWYQSFAKSDGVPAQIVIE